MPNNILITPGSASIQFSGSANNDTIRLQVEPSGSVAFYGNSGSLFSITDQLSGSLMSVNDISGLPILEVFSDNRVVMGTFNQNALVVTGSRVAIDKAVPTADLDISGSVFVTGSLRVSSGGITSSLFGTSSWANNSISSSFATNAISASYFSGSISFPNGLIVTGGLQATSVSASSGIVGNLTGTSSWASNAISSSFTTTASAATSITFTPTTASYAQTSSIAVSSSFATSASWAPSVGGVTSITAGEGLTGGTITSTGTLRLDSGSFYFADGVRFVLRSEGVVTSSTQVNYTQLQNIPTGIVSSSNQVTSLLPANVVSSSTQVDYTQLQNIPVGIVSSSTQVNYTQLQNVPSGIVSSSTQVNYSQLQNIPVGLVSSSQQINTGSFTGSFTGSLLGTGSWATTASFAISSSRTVTASLALTASTAFLAQTASFFDGFITFPTGLDITGSLIVTGSQVITGSLDVTRGITGSLLGTSSWANNSISSSFATTASFAVSASWAPSIGGAVTSITAGNGLTGGTITSTGTIAVDTSSAHFLDGIKTKLNTEGVISSSGQVSYTGLSNIPNDIVSSSTFSSPSQGTVRAIINNVQTDVDTGLQTGDSPIFTNLNINTALTASIISASFITGSHVQLINVTDTTSTNKVLVLDTVTNKIFTTASVGGGGGTGTGFPYNGTVTPAIISGSLIVSSSINSPLTISGSVNDFFELEVVNFNAGTGASSDVVVSSNNTTDFGNYAGFGINSTTYNGGLVGGASDAYVYLTSSVGELHVGNASPVSTGNVRIFAGGPDSDATTRIFVSSSGNVGIGSTTNFTNLLNVNGSITASSVTASFTGPVVNVPELSMAVSGTIAANATTTVTLNLNQANYFSVSASAAGTVTWVVTNPPPTGRAQTFVIEYTNGGIKTNTWFTNTRWPGGVAPTLTSASVNPDLLGFTTDDAGSNWRGVLLQRGSA